MRVGRMKLKTPLIITLIMTVVVMMNSLLGEDRFGRSLSYKGTWIWDTPNIVTYSEEMLAFAARNGVTHIYLYLNHQEVAPADYARFIKKASRYNMKVEALGGDPAWGLQSEKQQLQEWIEWVVSYNTNVDEDEMFAGIHLDIEPYLLPDWQTDRTRIVDEWLSNMDVVKDLARFHGEIPVTVDLPFWSHRIEVPGYEDYYVSTWMLKRFDKVVLMDYRDTAEGTDGIIANAIAIIDEATVMNKPVILGVEMAPSDEGNKTTFFEEGHEVMEQELVTVHRHFKKHDGFGGVAVHGFSHWMYSFWKPYVEDVENN